MFFVVEGDGWGSDVLNNSGVDSLVEPPVIKVTEGVVPPLGGLPLVKRRIKLLRRRHRLVGSRQEDDLGVGALGHGLHGLEIADLHGGSGRQDVGGLAHQLGCFDFGLGGNDLALADALALRRHGEGFLQFLAEDDVLDQHRLDLHAPAGRDVFDDLADALRDLLATLDYVLQHARADDVSEGGLGALD